MSNQSIPVPVNLVNASEWQMSFSDDVSVKLVEQIMAFKGALSNPYPHLVDYIVINAALYNPPDDCDTSVYSRAELVIGLFYDDDIGVVQKYVNPNDVSDFYGSIAMPIDVIEIAVKRFVTDKLSSQAA